MYCCKFTMYVKHTWLVKTCYLPPYGYIRVTKDFSLLCFAENLIMQHIGVIFIPKSSYRFRVTIRSAMGYIEYLVSF